MRVVSSEPCNGQEGTVSGREAKDAVRTARRALTAQQALWDEVRALRAALAGDLEENGFVPNFRRALES